MVFKTLLLNSSCEPLNFIDFRRLISFIWNEKVDIIETWDNEYISWINGNKIKYPAVIKLKYYVRRPQSKQKFNKKSVFRRDQYLCCYCGKTLTNSTITIDHIIPVSQGGKSTWSNCCSACTTCNSKKANKSLEEAGMRLLKQPQMPDKTILNDYYLISPKNKKWVDYLPEIIFISEGVEDR